MKWVAVVAGAILTVLLTCSAGPSWSAEQPAAGLEMTSQVEGQGDGGGEILDACPVQNPCNGETCVEAANCTETDTGKTACIDGDKIQRCIGGQTIHVKECAPCWLAVCCAEPGGCSCPSGGCGNSARWFCADSSEAG